MQADAWRLMELVVLECFGGLPDDPAELLRAFLEAEWLEKRRNELLARELADLLGKMWGR